MKFNYNNVDKAVFNKILEERDLRYKRSDFYHNSIIGREVDCFPFLSPKYKEHILKFRGEIYFDDFVMDELKYLAEEHSGGFKI